jgi:hypothetical protein
MRWLVVLALSLAQACNAPAGSPVLPAGAQWVSFNNVSFEGPLVDRPGILAAPSTADLEAAVVRFESHGRAGYDPTQACAPTCWRLVPAADPAVLYLALAINVEVCDATVKEGTALAGRTLYFIHWISGPNGSRCDTVVRSRWRLVSVSRRDLPGPGRLTVRLQLQGYYGSSAWESQVELA